MPRRVRATEFCRLIAGRFVRIGFLGSNGGVDIVVPANAPVSPAASCSVYHNRYLIRRGNLEGFDDSVAGARWVLIVRGHQNDSADRARCVREEPRIDAIRMEGVAALGQQAEQLVVIELAETDGALEGFFGLRLEALHEIVAEHREAFDDGSVETTGTVVLPPSLWNDSPRPSSGTPHAVVFVCASAEVDREKPHHEKRAQQHDDDNRQGWIKMTIEAEEIMVVIGWAADVNPRSVIAQTHGRKWRGETQIPRVSCEEQIRTSIIRTIQRR